MLFLSREKMKNIYLLQHSKLQSRRGLENTLPSKSHYGFALNSTNLSLRTNFRPKRYQYPVCHMSVATQHPLSRFQSSARGPVLSPTRSFDGLNVVARASLVENENRNRVYSAFR
jgi:hypothetical protein